MAWLGSPLQLWQVDLPTSQVGKSQACKPNQRWVTEKCLNTPQVWNASVLNCGSHLYLTFCFYLVWESLVKYSAVLQNFLKELCLFVCFVFKFSQTLWKFKSHAGMPKCKVIFFSLLGACHPAPKEIYRGLFLLMNVQPRLNLVLASFSKLNYPIYLFLHFASGYFDGRRYKIIPH